MCSCVSLSPVMFMHYPLKMQCLFHWAMGRKWDEGVGKDTTCWIQDFSSWNSLKNHIPPRDNTHGYCSVWTWWKVPSGAPFPPDTTNPGQEPTWQQWVSGKTHTHTEWANHGSSPEQSKKSTQTPLKCHQDWENKLLHCCNGVILKKQTQLS